MMDGMLNCRFCKPEARLSCGPEAFTGGEGGAPLVYNAAAAAAAKPAKGGKKSGKKKK